MSIKVSRPGKLYLAGEYAVLSGQSKAIIIKTKVKLHVTIKKDTVFRICDADQNLLLSFDHEMKMIESLSQPYLKEAIHFCYKFLKETDQVFNPFHLSISNDLNIQNLEKLGLGSSAALTIAVIDAILKYHDIYLKPIELYKAGVLTQINRYPYSSFGDLACSSFDHPIIYQKFDHKWLKDQMNQSLNTLIFQDWQGLIVEPFDMPKLPILFIYTNQAANSQHLVKAIETKTSEKTYHAFIESSKTIVDQLIDHLKNSQSNFILSSIQQLNKHLKLLALEASTPLFTPIMNSIEADVMSCHGAFKFSGAGGGDCVIAIFKDAHDLAAFKQKTKNKYHIINDMIEGLN